MKERINKSYNITQEVVDTLSKLDIEILYPLLWSNTSYNKAKKLFLDSGPSVFSFVINEKKDKAMEILKKLL